MKKNSRLALGLIITTALAAGCAGPGKTTVAEPAKAAAPAAAMQTDDADAIVLQGKVVETMTTGNYTYVKLEKDGKRGWAAVPARKVSVGDEVELRPGTEMGQFSSSSLKKTFKNIYFSTGFKDAEGAAKAAPEDGKGADAKADPAAAAFPAGHPKVDMKAAAANAPAAPAAAAGNLLTGKVVETADAGGYTYILLENEGKKSWAAVPATSVTVGQQVKLLPGGTMENFTSKTLNKTFDKIIFSGGIAE